MASFNKRGSHVLEEMDTDSDEVITYFRDVIVMGADEPNPRNDWVPRDVSLDEPQPTCSYTNQTAPPMKFIKWNHYLNNMFAMLYEFLQTGSFTDVTLMCDGQCIRAHKMILSSCSSLFSKFLPKIPCRNPIVIICGIKKVGFRAAVDFMYTGQTWFPSEHNAPLILAGESLMIHGLSLTGWRIGSRRYGPTGVSCSFDSFMPVSPPYNPIRTMPHWSSSEGPRHLSLLELLQGNVQTNNRIAEVIRLIIKGTRWRNELEEIMEVASVDSELWVSMLSEILKTLPSTGSLNTHRLAELDEARPVFGDMVTELKRLVNRHSELAMLPMECLYLNKSALISVVGQQPSPVKYFTLKRKPKSAALRAELLQKSSDAVSNLKKPVAPTVPVRSRGMPRKMTDTTPLKGLPSRWTARGNATGPSVIRGLGGRPPGPSAAVRKDGGIKLLDIADQPATLTQKKRRRMLELEEQQKKNAMEAEAGAVAAVPSTASTAASTAPAAATSAAAAGNQALPEYARGLNNYVMPSTPAAPSTAQNAREQGNASGGTQSQPSTPLAHTPKTPHIIIPAAQAVKVPGQETPSINAAINAANVTSLTSGKHPIIIQGHGSKPILIGQQQKVLITGQPGQKPLIVTAGPGGTLLSGQNILKTSSGVPVILTNSVLQHATQNSQGQAIIQGGKTVVLTNVKQMNPGVVQQGLTSQGTNVIIQTQQVVNPSNAQLQSNTGDPTVSSTTRPQANSLPSRGLSLTRDQMLEAQDMFKNANRVTRPEKALILGFMAGSRENPCPNLGNIVTIKLSENQENVLQRDDTYLTMLCETHFQMNYNNGQWMRIKKYRSIEGATPQPNIPQHVS